MTTEMDHPQSLPAEFDGWFSEHPDQDRAGFEEVWRLSGRSDDAFIVDQGRVETMRRTLEQSLNASESGLITSRPRWIWLAAAVVAIALGTWWMLVPVIHEASPGESTTFELSDGSVIRLNAGSKLEHDRLYGITNRSVELDGEAFLEVASTGAEFSLSTFNGRVEVLGTRFNVRARAEETSPATTVWVEEGAVKLAPKNGVGRTVLLGAGMMGTVSREGIEVDSTAQDAAYDSWMEGGFDFADVSLGDVLAEVERRFDVQVEVSDDSLSAMAVSIHLSNVREAGTILELVAAIHDLDIQTTLGGYRISSK